MSKTKPRARYSNKSGALEVVLRPQHSLPGRIAGFCWRARYELVLIIVGVAGYWWLEARMPTPAVWSVLIAVLVVVAVIRPVRRFVNARVMCVVTRHRMRSCLAQVRAMNHDGNLPWFLWTRPTPVGERVRLWMRPGLAAKDIENAADYLAAACMAREVRVTARRSMTALVIVDVIRRDPLVAGADIDSPLVGLSPAAAPVPPIKQHPISTQRHLRPVPTPAVPTGHERQPDSEPAASEQRPKRRTTTKNTNAPEPVSARESAPVLVGGEDVTDYV